MGRVAVSMRVVATGSLLRKGLGKGTWSPSWLAGVRGSAGSLAVDSSSSESGASPVREGECLGTKHRWFDGAVTKGGSDMSKLALGEGQVSTGVCRMQLDGLATRRLGALQRAGLMIGGERGAGVRVEGGEGEGYCAGAGCGRV